MALHVAEDLFSTMIVVLILAAFMAALFNSYDNYSKRLNACDDFDLALDVAGQLRDRVLVTQGGESGLLGLSHERLENYSKSRAVQGVKIRVEVKSIDGRIIFSHGPLMDAPQSASASIPAAVACGRGSAMLCELSVRIWRG